jgi:hypothetical protein
MYCCNPAVDVAVVPYLPLAHVQCQFVLPQCNGLGWRQMQHELCAAGCATAAYRVYIQCERVCRRLMCYLQQLSSEAAVLSMFEVFSVISIHYEQLTAHTKHYPPWIYESMIRICCSIGLVPKLTPLRQQNQQQNSYCMRVMSPLLRLVPSKLPLTANCYTPWAQAADGCRGVTFKRHCSFKWVPRSTAKTHAIHSNQTLHLICLALLWAVSVSHV